MKLKTKSRYHTQTKQPRVKPMKPPIYSDWRKFSWGSTCFLLVVACVSALSAHFIFPKGILNTVNGITLVLALLGVLVQVGLSTAKFFQQQYLSVDNQVFEIAIKSPVAEKAFTKRVEFCEKYVNVLNEAFFDLHSAGASPKALDFALKAQEIREGYFVWLPSEIYSDLALFERNLRIIGAYAEDTSKPPERPPQKDEYESKALAKSSQAFTTLLGLLETNNTADPEEDSKETDKKKEREKSIGEVKNLLRDFLGIDDYVYLATTVGKRSRQFAEKNILRDIDDD